MLDIASWEHNPIRFLVVDLILVAGLDMSAAEAFVRLQRLLSARDVVLVLCGCTVDSPVGKAFQAVNLWADRGTNVEVFANLNEALEWTENVYLKAWFTGSSEQKLEAPPTKQTIGLFHRT
jgi:SulP family sulfate permease